MEVQEERDVKKWIKIDIVTKDIKVCYEVISSMAIDNITFTITTDDEMAFNLLTEDIEYYKDEIVKMEQSVTIEHEKKVVQLMKNVKILQELGFSYMELS